MRQNRVVFWVDLVSLLLVAGSAAAVVILGVLIYRGLPGQKKPEPSSAGQTPLTEAPVERLLIEQPKRIEAEVRPPVRLAPVPVEMVAEVSEAPDPFSEEPMILRKRRAPKSALPTDTTALKGISTDAGMGGVLVISAPKRKVRAYRNATSPSTSAPRRRKPTRNVAVPASADSALPVDQKQQVSDPSSSANGLSS
jgi:hypothetical protein